jgi:hypothetical protein
MTTSTRLIPADLAAKLTDARMRLRLAKCCDNPGLQAQVLTEIDELLDQIGGCPYGSDT